ncbi:acetyltransferase (GNAT) family protein [Rivularia sp. PCC 7116]|uniref:GNAT family N-acetyltransferase n=1 Tax=Rivularia sp. PCC 7116 TaxID=373994 RepID=UPI00029EFCB1|nr:GNAT family N-acetyltransferase [Rivularia sp. PCC 7116]AFY56086.1 acetyltransferase (GNAT) family protein [Rivularia sp. PCC 7116]
MLVNLAESDEQILECFPTIFQLRPHLNKDNFVEQVRRQQKDGYQLAFIKVDNQVVAVAGFFVSESLAHGKFLYVYDLVVDENVRSKGYGKHIFDWLLDYAKSKNCNVFRLDSGVQRFDAHRFYFTQRMKIASYHFSLSL